MFFDDDIKSSTLSVFTVLNNIQDHELEEQPVDWTFSRILYYELYYFIGIELVSKGYDVISTLFITKFLQRWIQIYNICFTSSFPTFPLDSISVDHYPVYEFFMKFLCGMGCACIEEQFCALFLLFLCESFKKKSCYFRCELGVIRSCISVFDLYILFNLSTYYGFIFFIFYKISSLCIHGYLGCMHCEKSSNFFSSPYVLHMVYHGLMYVLFWEINRVVPIDFLDELE